jgi:hypothetical protein
MEVLLLIGLGGAGRLQLRYASVVGIAPFGRCQIRPPQSTRGEIVAVVPHDAKKRFVRLDNPAIEVPDEDPHEVGVDQPPQPGFQPAPTASKPKGLVHLPDSVIKPRPRGLRGSAKVAVAGL